MRTAILAEELEMKKAVERCRNIHENSTELGVEDVD
jgi:hypothetical protein